MIYKLALSALLALAALGPGMAGAVVTDRIATSGGDLVIGLVGHGSVYFEYQGKVIQVDPWSKAGDYAALPKADLVLITHEHQDHLDKAALALTAKPGAPVVANANAGTQVPGSKVVKNGDTFTELGLTIAAVPAYNQVHKRPSGEFFHPKGVGNGYVIAFGDKKVYVAGDTEDIPEMAALAGVDVAFIPVNLPYTMTPEMAVNAARLLKPGILYPYHTGDTDMAGLEGMLKTVPGVDVRIRPMR